ncbi:MAG: histidine phosphatase family protein [Armatimonadetes bacterium]|nr:histidine phosphatase family protein [Armatimonadota bacterium]
MSPTTIYLIRHAETTWNAEGRLQGTLDAPLSERGQEQVRRLIEALRAVPLAAVYSSPLGRAHATADPIAAAHAVPLRTVAELREMAQGEWEGRLISEVRDGDGRPIQARVDSPVESVFPGGETMEHVQTRAVAALRMLAERHPGEVIAVVAHGGVNKTLLLSCLGAPLGHHARIAQGGACINIIELGGPLPRVTALNNTVHLDVDP